MPIYEYRCKICGSVSECPIGVGGGEPTQCETCGSKEMEMNRILSAASVSVGSSNRMTGHTGCGREERCETLACSSGGICRRG